MMLLYLRPKQRVDSFTVTVTAEHWEKGRREKRGATASTCAVAQAVSALHTGVVITDQQAVASDTFWRHDGSRLVRAFDNGDPFPGETLVTFTREAK